MSTILGTSLNGRYRLEARIAAGGMSTVYRAFDETLERQVAVKLMHREVATDSDQLERFRREARSVARLSHPHIVGVIDTGDDGDPTHPRPYIVLEYVEGETLKERIRRNGRLPITEAIAYAIEIARALGLAHAQHIVHRDVKPQNVLIDHEGSAKVTDFGIARTLEEDGLTADGRVLGTTDYVSPEQALGRHVTGQSDLYSLGVVLYEMLTGEVPFTGESQVAVAMKHVREELPDVQVKRPEISAALASVVEIATAKRESDRYADDAEMIADLEDVLELETARAGGSLNAEATSVMRTLPESTQRRLPMRLRHPWYLVVGVLVIAAIVAGVLVFLANRTHHGTPGAPPQQHAPEGHAEPDHPVFDVRARLQPRRAVRSQEPAPEPRQPRDRRQPVDRLDDRVIRRRRARQAGGRAVCDLQAAGRGRLDRAPHRHAGLLGADLRDQPDAESEHVQLGAERLAQARDGAGGPSHADDPATDRRRALPVLPRLDHGAEQPQLGRDQRDLAVQLIPAGVQRRSAAALASSVSSASFACSASSASWSSTTTTNCSTRTKTNCSTRTDEDEDDELEAVPIRIVTVEPFVRSEPPGGDWVSTRPTLDGSVTGRVFMWATSPAA